jgi:hypothetical protein
VVGDAAHALTGCSSLLTIGLSTCRYAAAAVLLLLLLLLLLLMMVQPL